MSPNRGRVPAASRERVVEVAEQQFLAGQRIDLLALANELGVSRVSLYRWFGSREGLLELLLLRSVQRDYEDARRRSRGVGAKRVLSYFDTLMRRFERADYMRAFVAQEPVLARRLKTDPRGAIHQAKVAAALSMIRSEIDRDDWHPPVDPDALAYVAVHLMDDLHFSDPGYGLHGDRAALHDVLRALVGLPAPG